MKIRIISVGKLSDSFGQSLQDEYTKRLSKWTTVEWQLISHANSITDESQSILKLIKPTDFVILLDEHGKQPDNNALAFELDNWLMSGKQIIFVIGGAFGVDKSVMDRANYIWSISNLVFPHQLMRVLLLEQLYRTFSLSNGGKYHHK